jgi:hypothetical protein
MICRISFGFFLAALSSTPLVANPPVDLGPNVLVFDPSTPAAEIQAKVDEIFKKQERAQFGADRYAILFKPGSYNVNVRVGFYTQVLGLGLSPDEVTINGGVTVDAQWHRGVALVNFWRSAENFTVVPTSGTTKWAVSQASPLRRVHIKGSLVLDDGGWSSGGFLADAKVDSEIKSGTQQQWLTRNATIGKWTGSNWNMVFVGVNGAPVESFPKPPYVTVDRTPVVREKPFLRIDAQGNYSVFVPALSRDSIGPTWEHGTPRGTSIPIAQFYIAYAETDTADTLNAALREGKHLLLTPGIYRLKDTLRVTRADTVVLGLGIATLLAENGVTAMSVADVDGVKIAGILFDAAETSSPELLEVGPPCSRGSHTGNPTSLHDLFFRVGGAAIGKAVDSLVINSADVIGDNFWLWRADHGQGVGWTSNTTRHGLVVNGPNVTIYGLAVEHYQDVQTLWNADGGRVYFYQCEIPYDVPEQSAWVREKINGFAAYKVADTVKTHEAWGLGMYCFFNKNPAVVLTSAIEAPVAAGVKFHDMTTVSLGGGKGEITHVINATGDSAKIGRTVVRLKEAGAP